MSDMSHLSIVDGAFLHLESPEMPMHVGSLMLFELPEGYTGDYYEDVKALLGGAWFARDRIATAVIDRQLRGLDLPARYRIDAIGPARQVLRDVVIGDPRHPDLTIERIEIALAPRFGLPGIRRVTLVKPRLYGTWQGQRLSFGRLDRLVGAFVARA